MCIFVVLCVDETYYFICVNTVMSINLPKTYSPTPLTPPLGEQGLQIKSFLAGKRGKYRGKKEVAATVLIKTIKYYENTKYTLQKSKIKSAQ
jgi:hypothetical protein